ncbi:MAG: response regulator [Candidatus Abyssobacteria bacterium SURF_5]|uniref:Response regulator n=1 Tax=Abyssobacteria bacterium (strain SURF_5) TaxID=2093360 RepID=A0A3A4N7K8_ABYX5|nr:MAG: response regulator [Candidatus Abyssubacteria bacterium SURF_5]
MQVNWGRIDMGKKRVLVADDDVDVLEVIKAILEHEGLQVNTARDGEQAFKLLRKHAFNAVILDVSMPRVPGTKLLQLMRRSSKFRKTPAMLITGNVLETKRMEEEGTLKLANDLLIKPFNTRDLIKKVKLLVNSEKDSRQPASKPDKEPRV